MCNGALAGSEDYDPYGNDTDWTNYSSYKYANYYYDSNSGFYYLRNRFYDPSIGRFVSEDPVHDGMNWYAYAGNNPIMFVDPLGLYDRDAAVSYAQQWYNGTNISSYERFDSIMAFLTSFGRMRGDCANFVSQCMVAGGLNMTESWHYYLKDKVWYSASGNHYATYTERDMTSSWANADAQYRYFSNPDNGYSNEIVYISSPNQIQNVAKTRGVQKGDIAFMDFEGDGKIDHAIMISSVDEESGSIRYTAHTKSRYDASLQAGMENYSSDCRVYIVKIKDDSK